MSRRMFLIALSGDCAGLYGRLGHSVSVLPPGCVLDSATPSTALVIELHKETFFLFEKAPEVGGRLLASGPATFQAARPDGIMTFSGRCQGRAVDFFARLEDDSPAQAVAPSQPPRYSQAILSR